MRDPHQHLRRAKALDDMRNLYTIGYESATIQTLIATLQRAKVKVVVDVRALANSRRPGFAKRALSAGLEEAGITYLHLRGLGTPASGRAAARTGRHEEMQRIYREHQKTLAARDDLFTLVELVQSGQSVCLLCLEAEPEHCHRRLVGEAVAKAVPVTIRDLTPEAE